MQQENKMGHKDMYPLLLEVSIPVMISMFIQALYNIVDSRFVSEIGENAFTAVSMAFPLQNLMIGLSAGVGVGMNALLSRSLGEKDFKQVNKAAETGLFLSIIHSCIFIIVSVFLSRSYFSSQTENLEIINYGAEYISIITMFSMGLFIQVYAEKLLQSTGKTILCMICQASGAIINIILDPIFIFGYFGLPAFGVKGAAIATVIGQTIGAVIGMYFNFKYNKEILIRGIRAEWATIKKIYEVGIPSFALVSVNALTVFSLNKLLNSFSTTAVAALGVFFKIHGFLFMPLFGLNNGLVPILAYNYGAGNEKRSKEVIKISIKLATIIMLFGLAIFQIFPKYLLMIFNASDELLEIGIPAIRNISYCFFTAGFSVVCGAIFQALGNGVLSLMSSFIRQIVVLLPVAYLLSLTGNLFLVWFAYPIAEVVDLFFCLYYLKNYAIKKIEENSNGNS